VFKIFVLYFSMLLKNKERILFKSSELKPGLTFGNGNRFPINLNDSFPKNALLKIKKLKL